MSTPFLSFAQLNAMYRPEQDWLFEKLLLMLGSMKHLILTADQNWGIREYVNELGFQVAEKNPDFHTCFMDLRTAQSPSSFLELYVSALVNRFPKETSLLEIDSSNINALKLSDLIAKRNKIKIAIFLANSHGFHRFKDSVPFLRKLKLKLKNQKNCVFCIYGNNNPKFMDLLHHPGPLSGLGRLFELKYNPSKHRSASIRKLFHDHNKRIGYNTSVQMSFLVDNHPYYLKLLVWHALIMTNSTCTLSIVEKSLENLIYHFEHRFYKIAESLTPKQLNYLRALTEGNQELYSRFTRDTYQLGSSSNVARIKSSLMNKEIIKTEKGDRGRTEAMFADPIFREWLQKFYFRKV